MKVEIIGGPYPVAPDGIHVIEMRAGEVHDLPLHIAQPWIERGWAKPHVIAAPENKMEPEPPEKKDEAHEPEPPVTKPHKGRPKGRR